MSPAMNPAVTRAQASPATPTAAPRALAGRGRAIADALSSREWDELADGVLRRLEARTRAELDRRGRRVPTVK